jgi:ribosome biogenesis SPOUT family RNA methylase Rps3
LRKKGYVGRRLGPKQMTTDTAVRVTRLVVHEKGKFLLLLYILTIIKPLLTLPVPLEQISYVDYPEILINEHERTEMPFRYVKDAAGQPIMPPVSAPPITLRYLGLRGLC